MSQPLPMPLAELQQRARITQTLAIQLMAKWIPNLGYTFSFNKRASSLAHIFPHKKSIELSIYWLHLPGNEIQDSILHEIAHALAWHNNQARGHNRVWKRWAIQVGAKPIACYQGKEKSFKPFKYRYYCPSCDNECKTHRMWKYPKSCGICSNGIYNPQFRYHMEVLR